MTKYIIFTALVLMIIASACYNNNMEYLYPQIPGSCDTTNITFSGKVKPILDDNCVGCHNSANASGSVNLDAYANVNPYITNGKLMGTINHSSGFSPMPKNGNKFSDCQINVVQIWINKGAINN